MAGWSELAVELDAWASQGRNATLWWRDDDSENDDPWIASLLALRRRVRIPLAVSAVPLATDAAFAEAVLAEEDVWVLQHGYAHRNHAPAGEKKCELAAVRDKAEVCRDLAAGAQRLRRLFGDRSVPSLVPPWNRIRDDLIPDLPGLGFRGLSLMTPRPTVFPATGLRLVNAHVDPIDWRGTRRFVGRERALAQLVRHLRQRRCGEVDSEEPTGLLTHHLLNDGDCWRFLEELVGTTDAHPAARWLDVKTLFQ